MWFDMVYVIQMSSDALLCNIMSYDMMWRDVTWSDATRHDIWYDMIYDMTWHDMTWHEMTWHGMDGMVWHGTARHGTVRYGTTQHMIENIQYFFSNYSLLNPIIIKYVALARCFIKIPGLSLNSSQVWFQSKNKTTAFHQTQYVNAYL